ncbi:MAG TPA: alpha/beta hydrolase [Polyangiaceae bacterium]|nr:alpha/beta hydrolase [Polyangiaceae bacterium]
MSIQAAAGRRPFEVALPEVGTDTKTGVTIMFKLNAITRFVCAAAITLATVPAAADRTEPAPTQATPAVKSGRLAVNGVDYYYEVHGRGEPLLLLHGGLGSIDMFGPVLTKLAETRRIIAVDLQGHGRTALGKRPFRLESIGDDMAALVKRLGYPKVDVLGYSLGGGVAFWMARQKPESVRRLVLVSTAFSDDGYYAELKALQVQVSGKAAPMMKDTPMYKSYAAVAPNVADFPRLLDVLGDFMRSKYDVSAEVPKLKMPVMLVYGDSDMFRPEHMIRFYQLLGGGLRDAGWGRENMSKNRLAILPDLTHYEIFASPRLATTVLPFLDGRSDVKSWAEQVAKGK